MDEKDRKTLRRISAEAERAAFRDGRKQRSVTFKDRKKQASKDACRDRKGFDVT